MAPGSSRWKWYHTVQLAIVGLYILAITVGELGIIGLYLMQWATGFIESVAGLVGLKTSAIPTGTVAVGVVAVEVLAILGLKGRAPFGMVRTIAAIRVIALLFAGLFLLYLEGLALLQWKAPPVAKIVASVMICLGLSFMIDDAIEEWRELKSRAPNSGSS